LTILFLFPLNEETYFQLLEVAKFELVMVLYYNHLHLMTLYSLQNESYIWWCYINCNHFYWLKHGAHMWDIY